jgi:hypothetical protein
VTPPGKAGMADFGSRGPRGAIKNLYWANRFLIKADVS